MRNGETSMPKFRPGILSIVAAAVWAAQPAPLAAQEASPQLPAVTVDQARVAQFVQRVAIDGDIVARDEVLVLPEVSGYALRSLDAEVGATVAKGDVLARLDDAVLKLQLAQKQSALTRAQVSLDQAKAQIASDEAKLNQAEAALVRAQELRKSGTVTQAAVNQPMPIPTIPAGIMIANVLRS